MRVERYSEKRIYQISAKQLKALVAPELGSEWTLERIEPEGDIEVYVTLRREVERAVETGQES